MKSSDQHLSQFSILICLLISTAAIARSPSFNNNPFESIPIGIIYDNLIEGCMDPTAIGYNPTCLAYYASSMYSTELVCGAFVEQEYCYGSNDYQVFTYASDSGEPVTIVFLQAIMDGSDDLRIYDGFDTDGELLFDYSTIVDPDSWFQNPDIAGYTFVGTSGAITIELHENDFLGVGSCESLDVPPLSWLVGCGADTPILGCTDPDAVNFNPGATIFDFSCIYPVVNDEPCGAIELACNANKKFGSFEGSTLSPEVAGDACEDLNQEGAGDIWYRFDSDGNHIYKLQATSGAFVIALFSGDECGDLVPVELCQQLPSPNFFEGYYPAGTYYFSVRPAQHVVPVVGSLVSLDCYVIPDAPVNDEVCDALPLTCNGPIVSQNIGGATVSPNDPCSAPGGEDVWYTFDADGSSNYRVGLVNSADPYAISLYASASCEAPLTAIETCQTDPLYFEGAFDAGTYFFRVRNGKQTLSTSAQIAVSLTCNDSPPANDEPCGAFELSCAAGPGNVLMGSFSGSTVTSGIADECTTPNSGDVWLRFEAEMAGIYVLNQTVAPSSRIAVYSASDCSGEMTSILGCSSYPLSEIALAVPSPGLYFIKVIAPINAQTYGFRLLCPSPPPVNDLACQAIDINCNTESVSGNNIFAGQDQGCGYSGGNGVWYHYSSDFFGTVTLNTCHINTNFRIDISISTGSDCSNLTCQTYSGSVSGCDGHPSLTFDVVPNEDYYILVSGYFSYDIGSFEMSIACEEVIPDCPELNADFGTPCDDGNPLTYGDAINVNCECVGQPNPDLTCGEYSSTPQLSFGTDWWPAVDSMAIEGAEGYLADMDVIVVIEHAAISYIRARLISPSGTVIELLNPPCGGDNINVRLDDDRLMSSCRDVNPPSSFGTLLGSYRPQSPLAYLNGESLNGTWKMEIRTIQPGSAALFQGTFVSWCLIPTLTEYQCPDLEANIGDPCDDGNPDTENDRLTADCECIGIPICEEPYPAVTGMTAQAVYNGMLGTWNPITGSIGCQHRVKRISTGEIIVQRYQQEFEASEIMAPPYLFEYGTDYLWGIRCGCSDDPIIAGPWSTMEFTTPDRPELTSFPNPTSAMSNVRFQTVFPEAATLEVYDLTGRRVAKLFEGTANPETTMSLQFDTSNLPQGIYVYRLITESATVVTRFMVVK